VTAGPPGHALVREFVARIDAGGDVWPLLAADAVVTINGTTPLSGRYAGIELIRCILLDTARVVIRSLRIDIDTMIGTGGRIAALLRVYGVAHDGRQFNDSRQLCSCVFGVRDGHIDEVVLFPDTSLIEMALYGRQFVADA